MGIQESKIVDKGGRVYLPYLAEWKPVISCTLWGKEKKIGSDVRRNEREEGREVAQERGKKYANGKEGGNKPDASVK